MKEELLYARDVYGKTLVTLGHENKDIVVLDADLSQSTRTALFGKAFPGRFFNLGVAEQNMMGVAAGLASCGKIPFVSTFAVFATMRALDQIRNTICYNNLNVKIVATHAGITVGPDGSSHQAIEDIGVMRLIPNITILVPCDGPETKEVILGSAKWVGPVYVRLGRSKIPTISKRGKFEIGRAMVLRQGVDISIIACGIMVREALDAAELLESEGYSARVVNMHTIKPIDTDTIVECAKETGGIVVCEEHMITGGLGSAVSEILGEHLPTPLERIGIRDKFGQSGESEALMREYNLTTCDIVQACKKVMKRK